jgi:sigma-B regulation protein RsbU (phosphoserine phosphatase)
MLKNRGIAFKLILFFTVSSALIFLLIFSFNYRYSRRMIEKNVKDHAETLVQSTVNKIETVLLSVKKCPGNMAYFLEKGSFNQEELLHLLRMVVENNPEIYGATIAFEPYKFDKRSLYFAPYFYKNQGKIKLTYLGSEEYPYFYLDWYQIPKELNRPEWSEPYFDEGGGNILMATYSVPFYKWVGGKRQFQGIVTADISLGWLQNIVSSIKLLQTGYGFLISKNGTMVTHPLKQLIMNETIFGVAEARADTYLREIARKMIRGESGFVPYRSIVSGKECWMYYTPIPSSSWSLAVLFPQDEFMADITRLNRTVIALGVIGLLLLSFAVAFIARSITTPLRDMARATQDIGTGNLDIALPRVKSGDEVGKLAEAFEYMRTSLKGYIKQLTETTAAKERIESELSIARNIQMGFLPQTFPAFPGRTEFDLHAIIEPAKEVGGDLYDYFLIDENRLFFLIGDVSDKGVPAALFMAVAKTLFKTHTLHGDAEIDGIVSRVNQELSRGNPWQMFVTAFAGILDLKTGKIIYCDGGHEPPFIIRAGKEVEILKKKGNPALCFFDDFCFECDSIYLHSGDALVLYTDGVTEAMNGERQLFGIERIKRAFQLCYQAPLAAAITRQLLEQVKSFVKNAPQSDDIAILAICYYGSKPQEGIS